MYETRPLGREGRRGRGTYTLVFDGALQVSIKQRQVWQGPQQFLPEGQGDAAIVCSRGVRDLRGHLQMMTTLAMVVFSGYLAAATLVLQLIA